MATISRTSGVKPSSKAAFRYFLYRDQRDVRITNGPENVAEQIRKKGLEVGLKRFDTTDEAALGRKAWLASSPIS